MQSYEMDPATRKIADQAIEAYTKGQRDEGLKSLLSLYEKGFHGLATTIAWIYTQSNDTKSARPFREKAAELGDPHSTYALAGMYYEDGNIDRALEYYKRAGELGNAHCLFLVHQIYRQKRQPEEAAKYLDRAFEKGDPFAIKHMAFAYMGGKKGLLGVPRGLAMYLRNFPALLKSSIESAKTR